MTDRQWTSVHEFLPSGLLKTNMGIVVFAGLCLVMGVALLFVPTKPEEQLLGQITVTIMIVGSLAAFGVMLGRYLGRISKVRLDETGLTWTRSGRDESRRWDEVAEVYQVDKYTVVDGVGPSEWSRRTDLKLIFDDGSFVRFNHMLSRYNELANAVQQANAEHHLAGALAALKEGPGLRLGPVRVDAAGLVIEGHSIPWERLQKASVGNGVLHCYEGPYQCRSIALEAVPNSRLLLVLLGIMGIHVGFGALA